MNYVGDNIEKRRLFNFFQELIESEKEKKSVIIIIMQNSKPDQYQNVSELFSVRITPLSASRTFLVSNIGLPAWEFEHVHELKSTRKR